MKKRYEKTNETIEEVDALFGNATKKDLADYEKKLVALFHLPFDGNYHEKVVALRKQHNLIPDHPPTPKKKPILTPAERQKNYRDRKRAERRAQQTA